MDSKVVVIIPAYNEAPTIGPLIRGVHSAIPESEILIVDDGSQDATACIAESEGARVIRLPYNAGYGAALQTGYIYSFCSGAKYCLQLDADSQHDPRSLPGILEELKKEEYDIVIGARRLAGDGSGYCTSALRQAGIKFFALLSSIIIKKKITDTTSGFIGFSRRVIGFFISDCFPENYPDADVLIMLNRLGYRIKEYPVNMSETSGKSMHGGFEPVLYVVKMLLSIIRAILIPRRSMQRQILNAMKTHER